MFWWALLVLGGVWLLLLPTSGRSQTEDFPTHAGLVVQFGDGSVETSCIDLGRDGEASGEAVLLASPFEVDASYNDSDEAAICKIEDDGCTFPGSTCYCQCSRQEDEPCEYWSYYHLVAGDWEHGGLSVSDYTVQAGDVEGWSWGEGEFGQSGNPPPLLTFEEICVSADSVSPQQAEDDPTAAPTQAEDDPATETPAASATPQDTPQDPAATETPTHAANPPAENAPTPTLQAQSLLCVPGITTVIEGTGPPHTALVLWFAERPVGGDVTDADGLYQIPIVIGSERPGSYLLQVRTRERRQIVRELLCLVPTPTPGLQP
jgi:hypothetical protein